MRRQRTALIAFVLTLLAATLPSHASAQAQLNGTFALNRGQSDDIAAAINRAVSRMNFVTRPIARGRLTRTNTAYSRITIGYNPEHVTIQYDQRAPIHTPANGTPVQWTREDGEKFMVSTEWTHGHLEQTFRADDGQRVNVYTLSEDGATLTMDITVTSPRLPAPVRYKLVFNRAS
jgi:hypothetical protein